MPDDAPGILAVIAPVLLAFMSPSCLSWCRGKRFDLSEHTWPFIPRAKDLSSTVWSCLFRRNVVVGGKLYSQGIFMEISTQACKYEEVKREDHWRPKGAESHEDT